MAGLEGVDGGGREDLLLVVTVGLILWIKIESIGGLVESVTHQAEVAGALPASCQVWRIHDRQEGLVGSCDLLNCYL